MGLNCSFTSNKASFQSNIVAFQSLNQCKIQINSFNKNVFRARFIYSCELKSSSWCKSPPAILPVVALQSYHSSLFTIYSSRKELNNYQQIKEKHVGRVRPLCRDKVMTVVRYPQQAEVKTPNWLISVILSWKPKATHKQIPAMVCGLFDLQITLADVFLLISSILYDIHHQCQGVGGMHVLGCATVHMLHQWCKVICGLSIFSSIKI